jgi:hypothetical protein
MIGKYSTACLRQLAFQIDSNDCSSHGQCFQSLDFGQTVRWSASLTLKFVVPDKHALVLRNVVSFQGRHHSYILTGRNCLDRVFITDPNKTIHTTL